MKTTLNFLKSLLVILALGFASRTSAQCAAGFTYTVNGGSIQFTNTSTYNTIPVYTWNFGDNTYDYSANPTHQYAAAGTYNVCLTLFDSLNTCSNTYCANVVATVGCGGFTVNVTSTDPTNCNVCDGTASASISGGTSPFNYLWSNAATTTSLSNLCGGGYNVTVTDANNCAVSGGANLNCMPFDSCHPSFNYYVSGNSAYFNNTSGSDSLTAVFAWDFGDNTSFTGANPWYHTYANPGTYLVTVTVTDTYFNCSGTYTDSVVVGGPTSCSAYFGMVPDSFNVGVWYLYPSAGGQAPFAYLWDFGDTTTSTLALPTHNYTYACHHVVCMTITDANNCTSTYCDSSNTHRMTSSNFMTSLMVLDTTALGIKEQHELNGSAYPNPASDLVNVSFSKNVSGILRVTDITGKIISEQKFDGEKTQIDVRTLPQGIYNVSLSGGSDFWNEKIVIIR